MALKSDTRRFLAAFVLMWAAFVGELLWLHVRLAPASAAFLERADLTLDLDPAAGRARVTALLEIGAPAGESPREISLVLPSAASAPRVYDADDRRLSGIWRSERRIYIEGRAAAERSSPQGRVWSLVKYLEPRLDLTLRAGAPASLRVSYEIDGSQLGGVSSLRSGRTILLGGWFPEMEAPPSQRPPAFTYRLRIHAPAGESAVASGNLLGRRKEGAGETSEWESAWPATDIWVLSAPLEELDAERGARRVRAYVGPGRDRLLARQMAEDALDIWEALEAWAGAHPGAEWQMALVERLSAIGRGQPPLVVLESGLLRRPAERPGTRRERRGWIAQEMARAWLDAPSSSAPDAFSNALAEAQGAVLAELALSGLPGDTLRRERLGGRTAASQVRLDWMMRCRAYALESAPRAPLDADGRPVSGLLAATKLPATLDTIASQIGDAHFIALATRGGGVDFLRRLAATPRGQEMEALLTREWLPDLSVESVEASGTSVCFRVADRGYSLVTLNVPIVLETPEGRRIFDAHLPPSGEVAGCFEHVRSWRRVEVDPERRIFQVEYANDALPREANPFTAPQKMWDARRSIARREYERALEEAQEAVRLDPDLREADYWVGFALVKMARGAEAVRWLERALAGPLPSDVVAVESLYLLGQAYENAGDADRARAYYRRVIEEDWTSFSVERARRALAALDAGAAPSTH